MADYARKVWLSKSPTSNAYVQVYGWKDMLSSERNGEFTIGAEGNEVTFDVRDTAELDKLIEELQYFRKWVAEKPPQKKKSSGA